MKKCNWCENQCVGSPNKLKKTIIKSRYAIPKNMSETYKVNTPYRHLCIHVDCDSIYNN